MRVLLINPEFPDTYWSFRHALPFEGKRCAFPPLGLIANPLYKQLEAQSAILVFTVVDIYHFTT